MAIRVPQATIVSPEDPAITGVFQTSTTPLTTVNVGPQVGETGNLTINTEANRSVVIAGITSTSTNTAIVDSVSVYNTDKEIYVTGIDQGTTQQFIYNSTSVAVNPATTTELGGVIVGTGLNVNTDGLISLNLPQATTTRLGGVKVDGTSIIINSLTGVLSATGGGSGGYTLPAAGIGSSGNLGGVKVDGTSITIDEDGVISGASTYALPTASTTVLGGVKVDGTSITIADGVISSEAYTLPMATTVTLGGVRVDGSTITIDGDGIISSVSSGTGTVTSVNVSGGSTGLTTTGGPITSSGTIVLSGTLSVANGGTGATTASGAMVNLLPTQTGNENKVLSTDGAGNLSWVELTAGGESYTLPTASTTVLGGVKVGTGLVIDGNGVLSATGTSSTGIGLTDLSVVSSGDGVLAYNNTTGVFSYTGPGVTNYRAAFTAGNGITILNGVISAEAGTDTNTTYTISATTDPNGANIALSGSDFSTDNLLLAAGANITITRTDDSTITIASTGGGESYTLPTASTTVLGGVKVGTGLAIDGNGVLSATGTSSTGIGLTDLSVVSSGNGSLAYDNTTGVFTYTGPAAADYQAAFTAGTGISISNGIISSTVTQYSDTNSRTAISVTDAGGDGSLSYNSTTGVITYTGPSASEVRAHFTAGTGITISNGTISSSATGTVTGVSVVSANGFNGTVATASTTPAITLQTTVNGLLKGNSSTGVVSAAVSGTDYAPATTGSSLLAGNGSGGFNNVTVGTGLSLTGNTLTATGGGGGGTSEPEIVIFKFTTGSGGNLTGVDSIVSTTSGVTATISDGTNAIVNYTFTDKTNPPKSIMTYGQVCAANGSVQRFVIKDVTSLAQANLDGGTTLATPEFIANIASTTFNSTVTVQTRMSDVGASAGLGQRAHLVVVFGF